MVLNCVGGEYYKIFWSQLSTGLIMLSTQLITETKLSSNLRLENYYNSHLSEVSQKYTKKHQSVAKISLGVIPVHTPTPAPRMVSCQSAYATSPCAPSPHCSICSYGPEGHYIIDRFRHKIILYTNTISTSKQAGSNNEQLNIGVTSTNVYGNVSQIAYNRHSKLDLKRH